MVRSTLERSNRPVLLFPVRSDNGNGAMATAVAGGLPAEDA